MGRRSRLERRSVCHWPLPFYCNMYPAFEQHSAFFLSAPPASGKFPLHFSPECGMLMVQTADKGGIV